MHYIPRWVAMNEIGGSINATSSKRFIQRLDALLFTSDIQIARAKKALCFWIYDAS